MSFHFLQSLFNPQSIAVIGASARPQRIGNVLMRNLLAGGFGGVIMPVNPKREAVAGVLTYPNVAALPQTPDLAIICTPAATVPALLEDLGRRGTRAAIIMAGYLATTFDADGRLLEAVVLETARRHGIRLLGGSTLGILVPKAGINATFSQMRVEPGKLGFVSQSDAVGTMVLDWALPKKVGFSHFVSLGDALDIGFGEVLDFLASDPDTQAILLYIESIRDRRSFMAAARAAARNKPVVAIKAGRAPHPRLPGGAEPATLGMSGLISNDDVFDAVLRRAGILRVEHLDELFGAVETVVRSRPIGGSRLVAISNGGGGGIMAEDSLYLGGYTMPALEEQTVAKLRKVLPASWDGRNPIDIRVDASAARYEAVLKVLCEERAANAILVMHTPNALSSSSEIAETVIKAAKSITCNLLTCWVGDESVAAERMRFVDAGIPTFSTPGHGARAFLHIDNHRLARELLMQVPPSISSGFTPDVDGARRVVREALDAGRTQLTEAESKAILSAYGIPVVAAHAAADPQEAAQVAQRIGLPVALAVMSRDLRRKWDIGGVAINLETAEAVEAAARGMIERARITCPEVTISGFNLQSMLPRGHARQLLVGVATDPLFGPLIIFGEGGRAAGVYRDMSVGLPPLNLPLAQDLIGRSRAAALLETHRGDPAADREAIALVLMKVSQLLIDLPEIVELDINPLFADDKGATAVDAHIQLSAVPADANRFAIQPYPKALEQAATLRNGRPVLFRPIRPEDEAAHYVFLSHMSEQDLVYRFFHYVKHIPRRDMARLTQIDYDREMAFIASAAGEDGEAETLGVVRIVAAPDNATAEFAIVIRSDMKGQGLGSRLMRKMIEYSRERGIRIFSGDVMYDNQPMLDLLKGLGFTFGRSEEAGIVRCTLDLQPAPAQP
ncbi:MAG: bifunctional acetate--CoA ligase family protein/GNAT family N-acetyltransferase [Sulfuritalea sp.]|nr:bifunctional acetate--CoA ligase family protein/GNAT family N-acetyltransferase [Sulfuritalea sp.]